MQMKTSVANGGGRNVQQKITMLISKLIQRIAVITKNRGATIPNFHASKKKQKSTKVTKKNFLICLSCNYCTSHMGNQGFNTTDFQTAYRPCAFNKRQHTPGSGKFLQGPDIVRCAFTDCTNRTMSFEKQNVSVKNIC